ncbi:hypothetical protein TNCV_2836981 [Trichonephila clavipes]|nr:hypothetical protein TNCV_2836981 [Trichonephila clavipes]
MTTVVPHQIIGYGMEARSASHMPKNLTEGTLDREMQMGVESRPTIERKTQQGGPVRSRKGRERTIASTSKNEQDQATRMPDEEVINNSKTRKGEERAQKSLCPWRSW